MGSSAEGKGMLACGKAELVLVPKQAVKKRKPANIIQIINNDLFLNIFIINLLCINITINIFYIKYSAQAAIVLNANHIPKINKIF